MKMMAFGMLLLVCLAGCMEGPQGPEGPQGLEGPQGWQTPLGFCWRVQS